MMIRSGAMSSLLTAVLIAALGAGPAACEENYEDQELEGRNFSGKDLRQVSFADATLKGCNFQKAVCDKAVFTDADLRGSSFYQVRAPGANFEGVILAGGTSFNEANLEGASFKGVDFKGITLDGVNFKDADLRGTTGYSLTTKCNFKGADLRGANMSGATAYTKDLAAWDLKFKGARYDAKTIFPEGFDPQEIGAVLVEEEEEAGAKPDGKKPDEAKAGSAGGKP